MPVENWFVCAKHAGSYDAPEGVLFEDDLAYLGHVYRPAERLSTYGGYLVAEPRDMPRAWVL